MSNKILLQFLVFLLYLLVFNPDNCFCQWQPDVRLTNAPDSSRTGYHNSNIATSGNFVHLFWSDKRNGNFQVYYRSSTNAGLAWGTETRLTNTNSFSGLPSCTVQGQDVHVVWSDNRSMIYQLYYKQSTDAGITWKADTLLVDNYSSNWSYSHIVSSGMFVHLVWYDNRYGNNDIFYKRSTDGGMSWGDDIQLTNDFESSTLPAVVVSGSNVHIVWYSFRDGNQEIYYKRSTDGGLTWDVDTRLTYDSGISNLPSIGISGSNLHLVWQDSRFGNYEIYYKKSTDGGINWSEDMRLTNDPSFSYYPSLSVSGSNLHVIWQDNRDGNYEIYNKLSTNGGLTWSEDTRLTYDPSSSERPGISISNSNLHVVWSDTRDGNYEIYYKRNPTGNPIGILPISSEVPKVYKLMQNYPNPFNPVTQINFVIPKQSLITLKVYDILGREVTTLVNEVKSAGTYSVDFNGPELASGLYFYRLQSGEFTDIKRMTLIK